jgi:hypothetical protein
MEKIAAGFADAVTLRNHINYNHPIPRFIITKRHFTRITAEKQSIFPLLLLSHFIATPVKFDCACGKSGLS